MRTHDWYRLSLDADQTNQISNTKNITTPIKTGIIKENKFSFSLRNLGKKDITSKKSDVKIMPLVYGKFGYIGKYLIKD